MKLVFLSLFCPAWVNDSRVGSEFFAEMRSLAIELFPTVFGTAEPLDQTVSAADITGISRAWSEDVFWKNANAKLYGRVLHARGSKHSSCKIRFEMNTIEQGRLARFFSATASLLQAEYGAVHLTGNRANHIDERFQGLTSRYLSMSLPGVPWLACYGKPYTKMFGTKELLGCPAFRTEKISETAVIVQSTEFLTNAQSSNTQFSEIQTDIIDHLGQDAFFDPLNPNQSHRVPVFSFAQ